MRRFLEGRVHPRTLVWTYALGLVAAAAATLLLLGAVFLRYLPHDVLVLAGFACAVDSGCAALLPVWADMGFSFLVGGAMIGLAAFFLLSLCGQLGCSKRHRREAASSARALESVAPRLRGRVLVTPDLHPLSYTVGFWRPVVLVSQGLLDALDRDELEAVLAHEEGHVARRDNLLILAGRSLAMTFALVPGVRGCFDGLRRNQELAADLFARERLGDGLVVAASLHKFARSVLRPVGYPVAAAFADEGDVSARIRGLLRDDLVVTSKRRLAAAVVALTFAFAGFAGSAAAFTQVTLAHETGCSSCHPTAALEITETSGHEECVSEAH